MPRSNTLIAFIFHYRTVYVNLHTTSDSSSVTERKNFLQFSFTTDQADEIKSNEKYEGKQGIEIALGKVRVLYLAQIFNTSIMGYSILKLDSGLVSQVN